MPQASHHQARESSHADCSPISILPTVGTQPRDYKKAATIGRVHQSFRGGDGQSARRGQPNTVLQGSGVNEKLRAWEGRRARRANEAAVETGARWHRALQTREVCDLPPEGNEEPFRV